MAQVKMQTVKKGFGLIEVLVAVTLLGIVTVAFSKMMNQSMKGQSTVTETSDLNSLVTSVQMLLKQPGGCSANIPVGTQLQMGSGEPLPITIQKLDNGSLGPTSWIQGGQLINLQTNPKFGSITVTAFQINVDPILAANIIASGTSFSGTMSATFDITIKKTNGYGSSTLKRSIPIMLRASYSGSGNIQIPGCMDTPAPASSGVLCGSTEYFANNSTGATSQYGSPIVPTNTCGGVDPYSSCPAGYQLKGSIYGTNSDYLYSCEASSPDSPMLAGVLCGSYQVSNGNPAINTVVQCNGHDLSTATPCPAGFSLQTIFSSGNILKSCVYSGSGGGTTLSPGTLCGSAESPATPTPKTGPATNAATPSLRSDSNYPMSPCQGYNPLVDCPSGYTRNVIYGAGSNYLVTCVKN